MKRGKKIVEQLAKKGVKPLVEGRRNFNNPTNEVEQLASERLETCMGCEHFETEPIEWLKVEDKSLPDASGKYCEDCGCVLSYKLRQSIEPCKKWQK